MPTNPALIYETKLLPTLQVCADYWRSILRTIPINIPDCLPVRSVCRRLMRSMLSLTMRITITSIFVQKPISPESMCLPIRWMNTIVMRRPMPEPWIVVEFGKIQFMVYCQYRGKVIRRQDAFVIFRLSVDFYNLTDQSQAFYVYHTGGAFSN